MSFYAIFNWRKHVVISLKVFVGVVATVALVFLFFSYSKPVPYVFPSSTSNDVEMNSVLEDVTALPVRLVIPSIDVDAEIQHLGLVSDGTGEMEVPSNFTDVGWYKEGVRPGMQGSAVIAGHLSGKKVRKAVFYELGTLQIGDTVSVFSAEQDEYVFTVVKVETYTYDASSADVFISNDGKARLNLITCGGEWLAEEDSFTERKVVFTELQTNAE